MLPKGCLRKASAADSSNSSRDRESKGHSHKHSRVCSKAFKSGTFYTSSTGQTGRPTAGPRNQRSGRKHAAGRAARCENAVSNRRQGKLGVREQQQVKQGRPTYSHRLPTPVQLRRSGRSCSIAIPRCGSGDAGMMHRAY